MTPKSGLSISVVIPTFNEEEDIRSTLNACVELFPPADEILVIDDSKDSTPDIARGFEPRGVRVIHREVNIGGRCGARNLGIIEAKGEVVVILNADVILPKDFIAKIAEDYEKGADCVLVHSAVINEEKLFSRFLSSLGKYNHRGGRYLNDNWTEGFSCKKEVAIKAGLFPVMPITITAGEDGYFGENLKKIGAKRVFDENITVRHYAPHKFKDFWKIQQERVSAQSSYFLEHKSVAEIFIRSVSRTAIAAISFLLVLPMLFFATRVAAYSIKKFSDIIPFTACYYLQETAFLTGKWITFFKLLKYLVKRKARTANDQ